MITNGSRHDSIIVTSIWSTILIEIACRLSYLILLELPLLNFIIQELYPYRIAEHFEIVDHAPELEIKDGFMPIPDGPGLGVELVEERVKPFLWAQCRL